MVPLKILLADAQPLTRAGLKYLLESRKDITIAGEVSERSTLLKQIKSARPDLLIIDYKFLNNFGVEDIFRIKEISPATEVLAISSDSDKTSILKVLESGIKGFLTKECSTEEIINAVYAAAKGEKFFCNKVFDVLMEKHLSKEEQDCAPTNLTIRETQVLKLIAEGNSTLQIAKELHLSPHTINTHRKNMIRKLGIKSPTEFVMYAIDMGIIRTS